MSKEIDAKIICHIFGWPIVVNEEAAYSETTGTDKVALYWREPQRAFYRKDSGMWDDTQFSPSEFIEDAYEVIENLQDRGLSVYLCARETFQEKRTAIVTVQREGLVLSTAAGEPARAICQAALQAVQWLKVEPKPVYQQATESEVIDGNATHTPKCELTNVMVCDGKEWREITPESDGVSRTTAPVAFTLAVESVDVNQDDSQPSLFDEKE